MKPKFIYTYSIIGLLLITGWFYWFQYRPANIRSQCYSSSRESAIKLAKLKIDIAPGEPTEQDKVFIENKLFNKDVQEDYYQDCLHKHGLE